MAERLIALGKITSAHGVRGQVKLHSYTEFPEDIVSYGALCDANGREYRVEVTGVSGGALLASIAGVATREAADALRGIELFVPRSALPEPEDGQYYHEDLKGLTLLLENGDAFGIVHEIHNFGAGDLLQVKKPDGGEEFLPFTPETVSGVDLGAHTARLHLPDVMQAAPDERGEDD